MPSDRALALATQWNTEAAAIVGGETVSAGHRHIETDIDDLTTALAARIANSQIGAANGVAPLDATAKVPVANLPDISTTRGVFPVASQAAMLALNAQIGAVAVRSDLAGQSFILAALPASNLANWLTQSPPGTVTSVNGQTGAVTVPVPALATTTTDGLMPAGDRLILSATGATTNQTLRYNGTAIAWATPVIWAVRTSNATLAANENCVASTGVTQLTLPAAVAGGHEISNTTTGVIAVNRGGTATISGANESNGAAISSATTVRVLPGKRAVFVANGGNWIAQGIVTSLTFTPTTATYVAGFPPPDTSDILWFLGASGSESWSNPSGAKVRWLMQDQGAGTASSFSDRTPALCYSNGAAGSFILLDVGLDDPNRRVVLSAFRLQYGFNSFPSYVPTGFRVRGTNSLNSFDATGVASATWTTLGTYASTGIASTAYSWSDLLIAGTSSSCRYFCFDMNNTLNAYGQNHLMIGEILLWGTLTI